MEGLLGRPGTVASKDSETGERLRGPGGSRAALLGSRGVLCVQESSKAAAADSLLRARFELSSLCCCPVPVASPSTFLVLRNRSALVGHPFSLSLQNLCVSRAPKRR